MSWYGGYDRYVDELAERGASIGDEPSGTCVVHGNYWTDECTRCGGAAVLPPLGSPSHLPEEGDHA